MISLNVLSVSRHFKNHQNDPLLIQHFLKHMLIKQHKLNWQTTHAEELAILADQQSKTSQRREKDKAAKIMNL